MRSEEWWYKRLRFAPAFGRLLWRLRRDMVADRGLFAYINPDNAKNGAVADFCTSATAPFHIRA